jgi:uncharacterized membrane protein YeaQ/YmgE (transglycosylase-associated protein family)
VGLILFLIILAIWGFILGGLARFAVPGPDPMSVWMTIALGLAGSFIGGIVARLVFNTAAGFLLSFLCSVGLLILYRKYVQHRPITGPGAHQPPPQP